MIGSIRGILLEKHPPHLLVEVHGIGYEIEAPMTTFYRLPELGEEVRLHTHLVVREDAHLLFGFATADERRLFRSLIKVNHVGARLALAILSGMEADEFAACIQEGDSARLARVPGIGKKTAERLIVEMRDRLRELPALSGTAAPGRPAAAPPAPDAVADALAALVALGYKPQEASRHVHGIDTEGLASEEIIRRALQASVRE
jgi:holliday junction DNA helicase RuvA